MMKGGKVVRYQTTKAVNSTGEPDAFALTRIPGEWTASGAKIVRYPPKPLQPLTLVGDRRVEDCRHGVTRPAPKHLY